MNTNWLKLNIFRLTQSCGHVGALLYKVADLISTGAKVLPGDPTCTDKRCYWVEPKGKDAGRN